MADGDSNQLVCRIITPEEVVFDGEVRLVKLRIADGDIGIMAGHQPIVSTVGIRDVQVVERGEERHTFATSDGFVKMSGNLVQILVEEAAEASEIDVNAAESRVENAEKELGNLSGDDDEVRRRRESLERERSIGETFARIGGSQGRNG